MNERQEKILSAVVKEYTEKAVPVGSKILSEKYGLKMSSATIRNDMVALSKEGFLYQPHTSAGRIPTDAGYKYFVEKIMSDRPLSMTEQKKLQAELLKLRAQKNKLTKVTAKLLSSLSGALVISGAKDDICEFGIGELLENPEFREADEFCKVAELLDSIDDNVESILKEIKGQETKIFIGKENPIKSISNCSMVVSPYNKGGKKGVLAIVGPKRMDYAKNKSLLDFVQKIIGTSAIIILVIPNLNL